MIDAPKKLQRGDYVVAVPTVPLTDSSWDIGLVRSRQGRVLGVWWLLADTTYTEHENSVRKATNEEYEHARFEHGIDR